MKVTFLGPAYPYRGGIATIIERLAREFSARGWTAEILTFRVQYPSWLFPGRTQFRTGPKPPDLKIERAVNTINPLNWLAVGRRIAREGATLVVLKYWTPFMAPCFGLIARAARFFGRRRGLDIRFVVQLDNVVPHERHWWDGLLTRFFVRSLDGFVAMSGEVERDLAEFLPRPTTENAASAIAESSLPVRPRRSARVVSAPHPLFDHFGERVPHQEACARLGLDPGKRYAMFFGLVREYKGLDLLLTAWYSMTYDLADKPAPPLHLLVVGEFYDDPARYDPARFGLSDDDVTVHPQFVPDEEVGLWFSAAEVLVLPYRSATQSGVTQIAYHFDVPMIVTDVGGLPEIVRDGTVGMVARPTAESLRETIEKIFDLHPEHSGGESTLDRLRANFPAEKRRFSWSAAADAILAAGGLSQ